MEKKDITPRIRVVAAIIKRDGKYLITQRRREAVLPDLWEFPSGKVEPRETDHDALKREVRERVGVEIQVGKLLAQRVHEYSGYAVDLNLYQADLLPGAEPRSLRVADHRWVSSGELENYPFPAADQATTDLLLGVNHG